MGSPAAELELSPPSVGVQPRQAGRKRRARGGHTKPTKARSLVSPPLTSFSFSRKGGQSLSTHGLLFPWTRIRGASFAGWCPPEPCGRGLLPRAQRCVPTPAISHGQHPAGVQGRGPQSPLGVGCFSGPPASGGNCTPPPPAALAADSLPGGRGGPLYWHVHPQLLSPRQPIGIWPILLCRQLWEGGSHAGRLCMDTDSCKCPLCAQAGAQGMPVLGITP